MLKPTLIGSAARAGPNVSQQTAMAIRAATVRTIFGIDIPAELFCYFLP